MEDRLTKGFTAGIIGGITMNIWAWIASSLNLTTLTMAEWAGIMIYGRTPPFNFGETVFALLGQVLFSGALGVAFSYLVPRISSRNLLFKGWFFSIMTWFAIYAVTTLFKVEGTLNLPLKTVIANFTAATIFGLVTAAALKTYTVETAPSARMSMAPAMKPLDTEKDDDDPNTL
ncbi:Hypothetical protein LUCI_4267 [Lucifera butyrica]|uniref:Uncharacterized protein n=1 Tax=Lucifera butyrica TaxID=1351585 RepID=A0A498RC67_9FIRM|nr:hypothetical protein [Lucifera butyrica]VBB08981.1 Hypothetical protein LUCI_4267 [Lucifera butyrica]